MWYDTKNEMEQRFQSGIEQYGFCANQSENPDEEGYQYPYRLETSDGSVFLLGKLVMSEWFDIRYLGSYNQSLVCRIQWEEELLQLEWYGKGADMMIAYRYDRTGKHLLTDQEAKRLLRDNSQIQEINKKAHEMCQNLYEDYKWQW
ncbi:MAG: hypothetical protein NC347_15180 [Clostridium sp.]|nr:hypothetical protein [Clostridium sp.]